MKNRDIQLNAKYKPLIRSAFRIAVVVFLTLIMGFTSVLPASALNLNTDSYVHGETQNDTISISTPYIHKNTIAFTGGSAPTFSEPSDIFIKGDYFYVADKGNNRIVKMTLAGEYVEEYKNSSNNGFNTPSGVFVDNYGHMFVADTGNQRTVHLNSTGEFIEEFTKPESELLGNVYAFSPYRLAFSELTGFLYVVQGKQFMTIDAENQFQGYVGAGTVPFSLTNFLFRKFASDEQKKLVSKVEADTYSSFAMDESGMLYATALGKKDQIRVINTIGKNIFPSGIYGERLYSSSGAAINPQFLDITQYKGTIITVTEQNTSKLFQYDIEGNLLAIFGGAGTGNGRFTNPVALDTDSQGNLYVLDASQNTIQVLEPTAFINTVHEALGYYRNGQYEKALEGWYKVLEADSTYPLARELIGTIKYKQELYVEAMDNLYLANNKEKYGAAYDELRKDVLREHFWIYASVTITVVVVTVILLMLAYRASKRFLKQMYFDKEVKFYSLKLVFLIIFHPIQFCEIVKRNRRRVRVWPMLIFPALTFAVRMLYIYFVNYPMAEKRVTDINILLEIGIIFLPFFTFCISNYALTTIMGGEAKFTELLTAMNYCLTPYCLLTPVMTALSYMFNVDDTEIFTLITTAILAWVIILILVCIECLNQYSFKKFLLITFLTVVGVLIIWAIVLLFFALASQVIMSSKELFKELKFALRE